MKKEFKIEGLETNNPNGYGGSMATRAIPFERKVVDFTKGIDTIATTEQPALVVDWERWQIVREILPMKYAEMPKNDKVPLLDSHSRGSIEKIKGSAQNWIVKGTELLCKCFVSESEPMVRQKIQEGHIDSVSIGYMTDKNFTVEIPKNAAVSIDGQQFKNDFADEIPLVVRTWWKTHELSLVPIGADDAAKFKSLENEETKKMLDKIADLQRSIDELKITKSEEKALSLDLINMKLTILKHN